MRRRGRLTSGLVGFSVYTGMRTYDVEARVIKATGEKGFAAFCSQNIGNQIWLVLDTGQAPDTMPTCFHPPQRLLTNEPATEVYPHHYIGQPIDLREHQDIPVERRGWQESD